MQYEYGSTVDDSVGAIGHGSSRLKGGLMMSNAFGFSLMELMVTIGIIAILAAIAVPNAVTWRNNSQFNAAVREVKSAIEGARMAAIRSNLQSNVTFNNTNVFTTQTQSIQNWGVTAGTVVNHQMQQGISIDSNFGGNQLTFNNRGMPVGGIAGTVTVQNASGLARRIVVTMVGSSSIQQ